MFYLEKRFAEEIIAHASAEDPNECCGVLAGRDGRVLALYRGLNAEASPYRYNIDSRDLLRIMREIEDRGWEILGIYHSHTHTSAYPSKTDVELAFYPDALYLIVSLMDAQRHIIRGFRICGGAVQEEELALVGEVP